MGKLEVNDGFMGFHGISWDFMGFYGILWDFMGLYGIYPLVIEAIAMGNHHIQWENSKFTHVEW